MTLTRTLVVLAFAATLSACGVASTNGTDIPFIQIDVSFNGVADCRKAGVSTVVVTFADLALPPQESPCDATGVQVVYQEVPVGKYDITVEGQDAGGNAIYRLEKTIDVVLGGPTTFALDLSPITVTTVPQVQIDVTFNNVADCQMAGVSGVTISFANESLPMQMATCSTSGVTFTYKDVAVGIYTATVEAQDYSGKTIYSGQGPLNIQEGGTSTFTMNLPPVAPPLTANIQLNITFNGVADCTRAGVDQVVVSFAGAALPTRTVPCTSTTGVSVSYDSVPDSSYTATVEGQSAGADVYAGQANLNVTVGGPTSFSVDVPRKM